MSIGTRVQLRRDTAATWTAANPTLLAGEVGVELPAVEPGPMKFKVGDGTRPWTTLPYFTDVSLLLTVAGNLAGLADLAAARTNLGLGGAATHAAGDFDSAGAASTAVSTHTAALDPHGDRAYSDAQLSTALAGLSAAEAPAAAQGNGLTHSGVGQVVGGVTVTPGMRVLDTANSVSAGLWIAQAGAWARPVDFASTSNAQGKLVEVDTGGLWLCVSTAAVTVDTTAQVWSEIDPGVLQFGSGLSKSGNTVSLALTKALVLATGLSAADVGAAPTGSVPRNVRTVTVTDSPVTAAAGDFILANATGGAITVNLPASAAGSQIVTKKTDSSANTVSVVGTIDSAPNATLSFQNQGIALEGDGSGYQRVVRQSLATGIVDYPATTDARYNRLAEVVATVASSGAAQTIPDPLAGGATVSDITLTAACTFTLPPNPATAQAASFSVWLRQDATGGRVPTFTGAKWPNKAGAPTFSVAASAIDLVIGESIPNGGGWLLTTVLNVG